MAIRLQKVLAQAGLASRRASEQLIQQGRVQVNGRTVTEMGVQVDPECDIIEVDGRRVEIAPQRQYFKLHKPAGYLSVMQDDRGRPALSGLVPDLQGVHPVGRLDRDSEGLILLTDDGELTQRMTHPRYEHSKEYLVLVQGTPGEGALRRLREGVELEDGRTLPADVIRFETAIWGPAPAGQTWLRFILRQGRKRQIRRMCQAVGHPVQRLIRVRIGPIRLGTLAAGAYRPLTAAEIERLQTEVGLQTHT